jgi:hypothetical protein
MNVAAAARPPDAKPIPRREGVHYVLEAAANALAEGGLWRKGRAFGPDQEAAVFALALVAMGVSDKESLIRGFLGLTIPVLARTPDEIAALSRFFSDPDSTDFIDQYSRSRAPSSGLTPSTREKDLPHGIPRNVPTCLPTMLKSRRRQSRQH